MSHCFKPTYYNTKTKQLQWINNTVLTHDLICFCPEPTKHLILAIAERGEKIEVTKEEKQKILQCLTTSEEITTVGDTPDAIEELGLDALFAEDFTEDQG